MSDAQNENIVVEPENKLSYKVRVDRQIYATLLSPENIKSTLSLHPDSIVNRQIQPTAVNGNSYRYDAQFGSNEILSNYMVETFDLTLRFKVKTYPDAQAYNMSFPAAVYPANPTAAVTGAAIKSSAGQPRVFVRGVTGLCPNPLDTMTQTIKVTFGQNGNPFTTTLTPSLVDAQLRLASKDCMECYDYCPLKLDNCKYFKDKSSELYCFSNDSQFAAGPPVKSNFYIPKGSLPFELTNIPDNVLGTVGFNRGKFTNINSDTKFSKGSDSSNLAPIFIDGLLVPSDGAGNVWYSTDADWLIETVVFKGLIIPINSPVLKQWMESERPLHNITRMSIERQLYSTPQWIVKSIIPENFIPTTQVITAAAPTAWTANKCISLLNTQCSIDVSVSNQYLTVKVLTLPNIMRAAPICTIPYCQPDITTRQTNVSWSNDSQVILQSDSIPINRVPEFLMVFVEDGDINATGDKSVKHNVSQGSRAVIDKIEISFLNDPLICATYTREQLYHLARENGLHQYDWDVHERKTTTYIGGVRQQIGPGGNANTFNTNWMYSNNVIGLQDCQSFRQSECPPLGTIVLLKFGKDIPLRNVELTNSVNVNTSLQVRVYCRSVSDKDVAILNVIRFGYKRAFIDFSGNITDMETAYVAQNVIDAYKSVSEKQSNNILTVNDRVLMGGSWFSGLTSKISEFYPQAVPYIRKALQHSGIHNKVATEAAIIKHGLNTVGNLTGNKTVKKGAEVLRDLGF